MAWTLELPLTNVPLERLPVAAAVLDGNSVIVAANREFVRLAGERDVLCPGLRLADIVAGPDRPAVEDAMKDLNLIDELAPHVCRITALRASPPFLWLAIDLTRLGPEPTASYLVCLQTISRRRRLDHPPNRRRQVSRARSGNAASDAAESGTRVPAPWPPLLMTLSHELRAPLTAIRGWAQMAEQGMLSPETMSRALTVIARNAASLGELVEKLFDLSRCAAGSLVLKRDVLDLNPLVEHVVASSLPAATNRNVALTVRRASDTLHVSGDSLRLEQVARNLVQNAIKFTPPGGHVHVHTRCVGSFAEFVVTDDGLGIPADLLPVIFDRLQHHKVAVLPSESGLGLGLALVQQVVHLHDGEVHALSGGHGQGSTFIVRLPVADRLAAARLGQEA